MKDANYTSFPGFDQVRNFTGKLMDKLANKIKLVTPEVNVDLDINKINHISISKIDIDEESIEVIVKVNETFVANVPGGDVVDNYGNVIGRYDSSNGTVTINTTVKADITELKELLKDMEVDVNKLLQDEEDEINKIIDQINDYIEQLGDLQELADKLANIDNKVDETAADLKNKIIYYLDKIENKLLSAVNSANKALQPVLLVKTVDGVQRVSQTIYEPTWMSAGDVHFVPTTYTAELIAPAYKKLVGVTNVYSMDRSKNAQDNGGEYLSVLNEANGKAGVAEVLEGNTLVVDFSAKKGYIYEVTYTSVDYSGMVVAKKFYVTVK
jgi:uncharacterized protein YdhG (YjbR/CyaY superfamily)